MKDLDLVLILDTETTGLDPAKDRVIEIAVIQYHLTHGAIAAYSELICSERSDNPAQALNRIKPEALAWGAIAENAWETVRWLANPCDAILAHNADFDRQWVPPSVAEAIDLPWIDTCDGVTWPQEGTSKSLVQLCLDHGVAVHSAHRALTDCLLLASLLDRCLERGVNLRALLARGLRPAALFQAIVSFDHKDKAKDAGFHWDAPTKRWLRKMAIEDAASLPFRTMQVQA